MVAVPSYTLEAAIAAAFEANKREEGARGGESGSSTGGSASSRRGPRAVDLLKVDCEGCEHEVMDSIRMAREGGMVKAVTGECHAMANLTESMKAACLLELRHSTCLHGITPYLTCRPPPPRPRNRPPPSPAPTRFARIADYYRSNPANPRRSSSGL